MKRMAPLQDELKAQLMQKAEAAIEQMLATKRPAEAITLSEIEDLVLAAGEALKTEMTAALVEASVDEQQIPDPVCPECGQPMRYKGHKTKRVITQTGEVTVKRAYYYCQACKRGVFPPG
jgi:hypothetical protein